MSFRLFIYYCAAWGACAAFGGWVLGRLLAGEPGLGSASVKGLVLGVLVALGLGLVDALAAASQRDVAALGVRLTVAVLIGAVGGLAGGFIGQLFFGLSDGKWPSLLVFGWTLTGVLIGMAPSAFDLLSAVLRNEERHGAKHKLRNGLIGGTVGGLVGGLVLLFLRGAWGSVFRGSSVDELWSPSYTGFVALGACIGLSVGLAQVILKEAWVRVDAGFRPGRELILTKPEITLGRAESCDVGLFGGQGVEKVHARITRQGHCYLLSDANTPGGTLLNGTRIAEPAPLRDGDRIQMGNSVLTFGERRKETAPPAGRLP
ncbi:MAG TPA: FHA domain-containing protein [Gemmataceae bacterium]|nr:FHA domain-containing protein [Gemmataceae bacterium]